MKNSTTVAEEIAVVRSAIDTLESSVEVDFTPEQEKESETLIARLGTLKADLEKAEARDAAKADADETVARIRKITPAFSVVRTGEPVAPSMGEYMAAYIGQSRGDAQATTAFRALAQTFLADVPGIIPVPVLDSVIDRYDASRPVFSAYKPQGPVPSKTFEQPYVTQHVAVDEQANEGDEVATQDYRVAKRTITAKTYAGALKLSQQVIDWSSPSALQKVAESFGKVYARRCETWASTALNAAAVENVTWSTASISALAQSVENAVLALEDNLETVSVADLVLFLSPDEYAKHMALFTAEGTSFVNAIPNFPRIVRGRRLPAYSAFLADTSAMRQWETRKGLASLMQISTLEWELGESAYNAFEIETGAVVDCSYAGS